MACNNPDPAWNKFSKSCDKGDTGPRGKEGLKGDDGSAGPAGVFKDGQHIRAGTVIVDGPLNANGGLNVTGGLNASGGLTVTGGLTLSNGPITFPDGTTQTTASGASVQSGIVTIETGGKILTIGGLSFAYTPSLKTITVSRSTPEADPPMLRNYYVSGMLAEPKSFGRVDVKYFQNTNFSPALLPDEGAGDWKPTPIFGYLKNIGDGEEEYKGDFKFGHNVRYAYEFFITQMDEEYQLETYSIKGNVAWWPQVLHRSSPSVSMQCIFQKM